ncbi:hypothetical protein BJX70DRAFT_366245 [Aspergillus crustosus]
MMASVGLLCRLSVPLLTNLQVHFLRLFHQSLSIVGSCCLASIVAFAWARSLYFLSIYLLPPQLSWFGRPLF